MTSTTFPDSPAAPLLLGPQITSEFFDFAEAAGGSPPTMVLRIVKTQEDCGPPAGVQPTFRLRADTGDAVEITRDQEVTRNSPGPGGLRVATAQLFLEPLNVYMVRIEIDHGGSRWQLQIKNNDQFERLFTWVVADGDEDASQPWINVDQELRFAAFVGDQPLARSVRVHNFGTARLTLSPGGLAPGTAFTVRLPDEDEIVAHGCGELVITYAVPGTPIRTDETYVVQSNDEHARESSGHNNRIHLKAETTIRPSTPPVTDPVIPDGPLGGACDECACTEFVPRPFGEACAACDHDRGVHADPV